MPAKVAIVGSKSLQGLDSVYEMIDHILLQERTRLGEFTLINGGEEGVDTMAAEVALERGIDYDMVPLKTCDMSCEPNKQFCFVHSYEPRSNEIADRAQVIYRIYDESCKTSTCEVTARFGDQLGKKVVRIPVDLLSVAR
jgi:hypothetical protein